MELRAKGLSYAKIAEELHVSKRTLINWSKECELQILNLRAVESEILYEQFLLSREKKLEMLNELLNKAKEKFLERDLSDLNTEKLFDLILRLMTMVEKGECGCSGESFFSEF